MTMYTKMTATGSTLIANPRTISKELESRIATSIARVIASHDPSKLTTKLVRQTVEKDVQVSLTNHKELLKRLMHQEFRKVKAKKVAKRVKPLPWKYQLRKQRMKLTLQSIFQYVQKKENMNKVGLHALQTLYNIQQIETGAIQQLSALYTRSLGAYWLHLYNERIREASSGSSILHQDINTLHWMQGTIPTPTQALLVLQEVYTIERIGIFHYQRVECLNFLQQFQDMYTMKQYYDFDIEDPESHRSYEDLAQAVLLSYFALSLGVTIGRRSFEEIMTYCKRNVYPYKGPQDLSTKEYQAQYHLISTVVHVMSNHGVLQIEADVLPHEFHFLQYALVYELSLFNIQGVSRIIAALRCFQGSENMTCVKRGLSFLLETQDINNGLWLTSETSEVSYFCSMDALSALSNRTSNGYAPCTTMIQKQILPTQQEKDSLESILTINEKKWQTEKENITQEESKRSEKFEQTNADDGGLQNPTKAPEGNNAAKSTTANKKINFDINDEENSSEGRVQFLLQMLQGLETKGKDKNENTDALKNVAPSLAMHVLTTLGDIRLTVDVLKSTGVGRVINKLRKHSDSAVAKKASELVSTWKKAVAKG